MAFTIRGMKIRNQILLVTLPPLFVLLCAVGLAFYAYRSVMNAEQSASRSKESVVRLASFLQHTTEAYADVRGSALNHRIESLTYYDKAVADGLADVNALNDLEAADPGQAEEVTRIQAEFDMMQKQWALPTIEKVRSGEQFDTNPTMADGQTRYSSIRTKVLKLQKENEGQNLDERGDALDCDSRTATHSRFRAGRAGRFCARAAPHGRQRIRCPFPQLFQHDHRPAARTGGDGLLELVFRGGHPVHLGI
jgi:CHASE3 domain sensor protein